jgi:hypothetical protein
MAYSPRRNPFNLYTRSDNTSKGFKAAHGGADDNTWGGLLNANFSLIDNALAGTLALSTSGNTMVPSDQAHNTGCQYVLIVLNDGGRYCPR